MNKYIIRCTPEQTKKAIELGAPIKAYKPVVIESKAGGSFTTPTMETVTAEQMISWLEEKIYNILVIKNKNGTWFYMIYWENSINQEIKSDYTTRKEATLAAIDAALEYLGNLKQ